MIVQGDVRARQVFDEQQAMMTGAEFFVDQPFQKHAFGSGQGIARRTRLRNLASVEMAEQRFPFYEAVAELDSFLSREKRIPFRAFRLGLRRRHLQPANRLLSHVAPGVDRSDLESAEISGAKAP